MRRRPNRDGKPTKMRAGKTAAPKRSHPSKSACHHNPGVVSEKEITKLTRERDEALEQQRATAEVLKIISASPSALQPVLEVVARSAARFCGADDVTIFELDGQDLRIATHWGGVPQDVGARFPCVCGHVVGRAVLERKPVHVIDLQAEAEKFPEGSAFARRLGHRTTACVPLLREGAAVGAITLRRDEVNPFTDKQIALLETFAAQAVIAVENTRLLSELCESLRQQTATADVLKVISSSPGDLAPVFDSILVNVNRICDASFANLALYDGQHCRMAAMHNAPGAFSELRRKDPILPAGSVGVRVVATGQPLHIQDLHSDSSFRNSRISDLAGARSTLGVPMLKDDQAIGAIMIYRHEVRPFTEKQIELVSNFANQAVIAIENARLLNELRESLQQQTATS